MRGRRTANSRGFRTTASTFVRKVRMHVKSQNRINENDERPSNAKLFYYVICRIQHCKHVFGLSGPEKLQFVFQLMVELSHISGSLRTAPKKSQRVVLNCISFGLQFCGSYSPNKENILQQPTFSVNLRNYATSISCILPCHMSMNAFNMTFLQHLCFKPFFGD